MADQHLRLLARRAAQGDREAESRLLLERMRRGGVSVEGLRFAAYLGHEPARAALGDGAPRVPTDLREWATKLRRWGRWNCVHAATAVVARLLHKRFDQHLQAAFTVAWGWLQCPCAQHTREAQDRVPEQRGDVGCSFYAEPPAPECQFVEDSSYDVARALHLTVACEEASGWGSYGGSLLAVVEGAQRPAFGRACLSPVEIRRAISADLLHRVHSKV